MPDKKSIEYGLQSPKGHGFDRRGVSRNAEEGYPVYMGGKQGSQRSGVNYAGGDKGKMSSKNGSGCMQKKGHGGQTKGK